MQRKHAAPASYLYYIYATNDHDQKATSNHHETLSSSCFVESLPHGIINNHFRLKYDDVIGSTYPVLSHSQLNALLRNRDHTQQQLKTTSRQCFIRTQTSAPSTKPSQTQRLPSNSSYTRYLRRFNNGLTNYRDAVNHE